MEPPFASQLPSLRLSSGLDRLLAAAAHIHGLSSKREERFSYSFTSLVLAFTVQLDSYSAAFHGFIKDHGVSIEKIAGSIGLDPRRLSPAIESKLPVHPALKPEQFTSSAQSLFDVAVSYMKSTSGSELDTRHLMAALIYQPGGHHPRQMEEWGIDRRQWSEVFVATARVNHPDEAKLWSSEHLREFGVPVSEPSARPSPTERVGTHTDDPATEDTLGRKYFAALIQKRIEEACRGWSFDTREQVWRGKALMVHIHGPWGSGKSSVLNFLRSLVESSKEPWLVVEYNAWKFDRIKPPWWALISQIYRESLTKVPRPWRFRWRWFTLRGRADWLPALAALTILLAALAVANNVIPQFSTGLSTWIAIAGGVVGAGVSLFAISRSLLLGSARAAQTYTELSSDPLSPIVRIFNGLVEAAGRRMIILIDDLDRCDGDYVVEFLEGIQTLFRDAPVVYLVAADRKWICSSFEKKYADFGKTIGNPGRPLGHLFLEKLFQVSAPLPRLSHMLRDSFWRSLLVSGRQQISSEELEAAERAARQSMIGLHTESELNAKVAEAGKQDPVRLLAYRAAAAMQITSEKAQEVTEHRMQPFAPLLEPNPRAMKRLVNAFGLNQAVCFLEGRIIPFHALARWTILELRWPLLAEFLAENPHKISAVSGQQAERDGSIPRPLALLFTSPEVIAVVSSAEPVESLRQEDIQAIVGTLDKTPAHPNAAKAVSANQA
jgi:hypothetical protein